MSELISGKEAKLAWANGHIVQWRHRNDGAWIDLLENRILSCFDDARTDWRIKPRTIMIGDMEVPAPFEPEIGDEYWIIETSREDSYSCISRFENDSQDKCLIQLGAWRTESEIKQVVAALRKLFKGAPQ